jgi:ribonuclease HI
MHFKLEYTSPGALQELVKIERKFTTLHGKSRAMLNAAKFNWPWQHKIWPYSANQVIDLENIIVQPEHKATANELFYDGILEGMDSFHKFSEIAIVQDPVNIQSKLKNQRFPAIYLVPCQVSHQKCTYFLEPCDSM